MGRVQITSKANTTFASSVKNDAITTTTGNSLIVVWQGDTVRLNGATVSDNKGNTFTRVSSHVISATFELEIWIATNITGGSGHIVTVADNGGGVDSTLIVEERDDIAAINPVDNHQENDNNFGLTGSLDSGTMGITTNPNVVLWLAVCQAGGGGTFSATNGFGGLTTVATSFSELGVATKTVSDVGVYNGVISSSVTDESWIAAIVAFSQNTSDTVATVDSAQARSIVQSTQVAWKKQLVSAYRVFTIGVSAIGGSDAIASSGAVVSDWNKYIYFDESDFITALNYERSLKVPTGGLSMGLFEFNADNTSGRFLPYYMAGHSELFTAVSEISRPTIINAGFHANGIDNQYAQFVGLTTKPPQISKRDGTAKFAGNDFISFLQDKAIDNQIMFTSQRTDQVIDSILSTLGFATSQYELDTGINTVPFGLFDVGTKFSDIIDQLVEAENGQFYQDENGILRFENRQHWDSAPYNTIQRIITTSQVIDAQSPDFSHLINVVEINGKVYEKQPEQIIYRSQNLTGTVIPAGGTATVFVSFSDPALSMTTPTATSTSSYYRANDESDGSGNDLTGSVSISSSYGFATSAKFIFSNSSSKDAYITELVVTGRIAKNVRDIYYRAQDDSSVTAYQEQIFSLTNPYIQNESWAQTYAQMLLADFSEPENLQIITVRAMPTLKLGDLVSWQGQSWRIFDIKTTLDPNSGFIQELTMLQRTIKTYFRIGISRIGGNDMISP